MATLVGGGDGDAELTPGAAPSRRIRFIDQAADAAKAEAAAVEAADLARQLTQHKVQARADKSQLEQKVAELKQQLHNEHATVIHLQEKAQMDASEATLQASRMRADVERAKIVCKDNVYQLEAQFKTAEAKLRSATEQLNRDKKAADQEVVKLQVKLEAEHEKHAQKIQAKDQELQTMSRELQVKEDHLHQAEAQARDLSTKLRKLEVFSVCLLFMLRYCVPWCASLRRKRDVGCATWPNPSVSCHVGIWFAVRVSRADRFAVSATSLLAFPFHSSQPNSIKDKERTSVWSSMFS